MNDTSPEVIGNKVKKDISPEAVAKRTEIWLTIEADLKRHCQKNWSYVWDDILSFAMLQFIQTHDIKRVWTRRSMVAFAKLKCLEGVRKEAGENGVPQREFKKHKQNCGGQNIGGQDNSSEPDNDKSQYVTPKLISIYEFTELGNEIGDRDPTESIEKTIFVKSLLHSALETMKECEAKKYIGAINLVFEGHELAVAARKNGLNPVYLSRWLSKVGYANGRPLPASPTKHTAQKNTPNVAVPAEEVAAAVLTSDAPQ